MTGKTAAHIGVNDTRNAFVLDAHQEIASTRQRLM